MTGSATSGATGGGNSFCLVTPNWQCQLLGFRYAGDDPDGFMERDEIVGYLEAYARSFRPPVVEGVAATRLRRDRKGVTWSAPAVAS